MRQIFTLVFLLVSSFAFAQVRQGDRIITLNNEVDLFTGSDFATFRYEVEGQSTLGGVALTLGYALSDRFVIGSSLGSGGAYSPGPISSGDGFSSYSLGLRPYLRYYAVNSPQMGVFGQVSAPVGYGNSEFYGFESLTSTVGVQFAVAPNVLLGPTVNYFAQAGRNQLNFAARLELVLGRTTEAESVVPAFHKGAIMLGGQVGELTFAKRSFAAEVTVGGHYFLSDRFAGGVTLGYSGVRLGHGGSSTDFGLTTYGGSIGVSGRYYLTTARRLVWYVAGGAEYQFQSYRFGGGFNRDDEDVSTTNLIAAGGGQYFLRENIALEFGPEVSYGFGNLARTNLSLNLGARFFLR